MKIAAGLVEGKHPRGIVVLPIPVAIGPVLPITIPHIRVRLDGCIRRLRRHRIRIVPVPEPVSPFAVRHIRVRANRCPRRVLVDRRESRALIAQTRLNLRSVALRRRVGAGRDCRVVSRLELRLWFWREVILHPRRGIHLALRWRIFFRWLRLVLVLAQHGRSNDRQSENGK